MPTYWFNYASCETDFQRSICCNKRPYFMTYVYDDYRRDYRKYIKESNKSAQLEFGKSLQEILDNPDKSEAEQKFTEYFYAKNQFGMGKCSVNKICYYVEDQLDNIRIQVKQNSNFDYKVLREDHNCTNAHRQALKDLQAEYVTYIKNTKNNQDALTKDEKLNNRLLMKRYFKTKAEEICPNEAERYNILLDMCYTGGNNRQFCWDCIGDLIVRKLKNDNI